MNAKHKVLATDIGLVVSLCYVTYRWYKSKLEVICHMQSLKVTNAESITN